MGNRNNKTLRKNSKKNTIVKEYKKKQYLFLGILVIVGIIAFFGIYIVHEKPYTKEAEDAYMKQYSNLITGNTPPVILIKEVNKNIHRVSKQGASSMVFGLISSMYSTVPAMENKVNIMQKSLRDSDKGNMDYNNPKHYNEIHDEMLKGFLKDLQNNHFYIEKYRGSYYIYPDIQYIVDTYGNYMADDLKQMIMFSIKHPMSQIFDTSKSRFDLDKLIEKIIEGEAFLTKYPNAFEVYVNNVEFGIRGYYQMYFGINNDYMMDNNKKVFGDVVAHYEDTIKKYPDSKLAKDLQEYLSMLEATNYVVNDNIDVWLLDLVKAEMIEYKEDGNGQE